MNKKSCAIVIPIYKTENNLKGSEVASLLQCLKVLNKHEIIFIAPENLDVSFYKNLAKENRVEYKFEKFRSKFFKSIDGYNSLLLRKMFYERFTDFEFILIYQLDAWVFEDQLEFWCRQSFDYIGAPWFEDYDNDNEDKSFLKETGNGGFSLRKVSAFLKVLKPQLKFFHSFKEVYENNKKRRLISNILSFPLFVCKMFALDNIIIPSKLTAKKVPEDIFFAFYGRRFYPEFKTPPPEIALKFSFELQPSRLFKINDFNLPFGCHDFERRGWDFWKDYIDIPLVDLTEK